MKLGGEMTERLADRISGVFLLAVAVMMGVAARTLPTTVSEQFAGPSFMPEILSICLGLTALGIMVQAQRLPISRRMAGWSGADVAGAIRIAVVVGATAAYNLLLVPVGYLLVTLAYLMFLLWYLKVSWKLVVIISVLGTIGTYALFAVWLKVVLPMGLIELYF